ncbi:MAG: Gfo/Idh/MocA family oxidoreductase [Armatimonadaceae bacterium]
MIRRDFLRAGAGMALSLTGNHAALTHTAPVTKGAAMARYEPEFADTKARVGLIGCGWYGKTDLFRLLQVAPVEVVSLCDVDRELLEDAATKTAERQESKKKPRAYTDFRTMLAERDLDIVLIATPDHWHALQTIAAVEAGADVYVQKPVSVDVLEGKAMVDAARKHNRVVQVGTQRRSTPHLMEARDTIVRRGLLGKVALVETYCYYHMRAKDNPPDSDPPESLDYDLWTGPAPMRPFNKLTHPRRWRAFMEYGNGIVGDMCVHMLDMVRWMMGLGWPQQIYSEGGILMDKASKANTTDTQTAVFDFGETVVTWQHRSWGHPADPQYPWGATLYGDKGTLKASVRSYDFIPAEGDPVHQEVMMELEEFPEDQTEEGLERHVAPAIRQHMKDFLRAIKTRTKPVADIEEGHISTASCILANNALELGRTLTWDPATHQVIGDDEANRLLRRTYRAPWEHPYTIPQK